MHTGKLDVLTDSIRYDFSILSHGIHFHFLGMLNKLTYYYRMFLRYIGCQFQETFQFFLIGANIHRGTRKHIRRTDKYRKTDLVNKFIDIIHRSQFTPTRLVYTNTVEHGREFLAILSVVNAFGTCTENIDILCIQAQCQIIRNLSTGRYNDAMWIFEFQNIHYAFESQFIEIEAVAHIVIRRYGFRIIVNHNAAPPFLANCIQCLNTTPVELNRRTDTIGTGA